MGKKWVDKAFALRNLGKNENKKPRNILLLAKCAGREVIEFKTLFIYQT
jgi:hypothetical protein